MSDPKPWGEGIGPPGPAAGAGDPAAAPDGPPREPAVDPPGGDPRPASIADPGEASEFDGDADADEAAELARMKAARWRSVEAVSERHAAALADPSHLARRAVTAQGQAAAARRRAVERARERGVPCEDGVLPFATRAVPARETSALAVVREALAWRIANRGRQVVLVILGGVGVGKSIALAWAVTHHGRPARYVTAGEAASYERGTAHSHARADWQRLVGYDLLAVDEIGTEGAPQRILDLVFDRYSARKMTLLAGNLARQQFRDRYVDARLRSRLQLQARDGQRVLCETDEPDLRAAGGVAPDDDR